MPSHLDVVAGVTEQGFGEFFDVGHFFLFFTYMKFQNWIFGAAALAILLMWLGDVALKKERACRAPLEIPNFLTPGECRAVIRAALAKGMERSEVVGAKGNEISRVRTSSQVFLELDDPAVEPLVAKVEKLLGSSSSRFEQLQVARYGPGQKYEVHTDSDNETPREDMRRDTVLMYLNTCPEGGHTQFPKLGMKVEPRRGKAVHWRTIDSHGKLLPCADHGGMPVVKGEKWIATFWRGV
jgi:prolyl 4-hydroxylase